MLNFWFSPHHTSRLRPTVLHLHSDKFAHFLRNRRGSSSHTSDEHDTDAGIQDK